MATYTRGSEIISSSPPKGQFLEGIVSGTPKPGVIMELKAGVAPVNGRYTYQAFSGSSGAKTPVIVLIEDKLQGKLATDAYVDGTRCFMYCPINGEELNMLFANIAGTGDAFAIGDVMMTQTATGKLIADSSGASKPFKCMETVAALTVDTLVHCMFTGQ